MAITLTDAREIEPSRDQQLRFETIGQRMKIAAPVDPRRVLAMGWMRRTTCAILSYSTPFIN